MTICDLLTPTSQRVKTCRECGKRFELPEIIPATVAQYVSVCPECSESAAAIEQDRIIRESVSIRLERWKQICPRAFLDTVRDKLPYPQMAWAATAWEYGPQGLLLHGKTGAGKSRVAWLVLKREWEAGRSLAHLNSSVGLTYAARYSADAQEVERWMQRLIRADLLLLDDIFKARLTDSLEAAIFTVILERTEAQRPILVTLNDTGETLLARLSPDRGEPLVRRLRESCRSIAAHP
ncbi:MAG TPA: hypothetical protein VN673_17055 [Clostridia bacterium]|nr:hypothetical protein [Clostridia bacterium]